MPVRNDFKPGEFCWIDLNAHDLESAVTWYGQLFDWSHEKQATPDGVPPYAFFKKGEATVAGIGQMSDEMKAMGIPPMWNSYICSDDCVAMEGKVKELGGTVTVPTMEIPGHGKLAFFMDSEGASFAAWQKTGEGSPGVLVGEPGSLSWNELMSRDTKQAAAFYGGLTGWEFAEMPMGEITYTMIKNAGKDAGGIFPMDGPQFEGVPANWMVYFAVADCEATAAQVTETGGKVLVPPTDIPIGTFSVLNDPQGGAFSVITVKAAC